MDDGYGFQVDSAKISAVDLAEGIELWRKCCPFYEFQIDLRGEDGALWFSLRGRRGEGVLPHRRAEAGFQTAETRLAVESAEG